MSVNNEHVGDVMGRYLAMIVSGFLDHDSDVGMQELINIHGRAKMEIFLYVEIVETSRKKVLELDQEIQRRAKRGNL